MKMYILKIILSSIFIGVFFVSCNKDSDLNYKPNLALPLVKAKFTLRDILKKEANNNNISTDANGFIDLIFKTKIFSKTAEELVPITNQNFVTVLKPTNSSLISIPPNTTLPTIQFNKTFSMNLGNGVFVDTITLKSGKLRIILNSSYDLNFNATIHLAGTNLIIPLARSGTPPLSIDTLIDLSNQKISLDNSSSSNPNQVQVDISLTLKNASNSQAVNALNDSITLSLGFEDFRFKKLYGKFTDFVILSEPDTVPISIFETALGLGSIKVDNPKLTTKFSNSFGVNVNASFPMFIGYNELANPKTRTFSGVGVPSNINPLVVNGSSIIGQSEDTSFILNTLNSNIVDVINMQPKKVIYQIKAIANTVNSGFILDTSKIDIDMEIDLPMSGTIDDFVFRDTIDYVFDKTKNIESVSLRSIITNGFPFKTYIQVYFANENNVVIDSLVKDKLDQIVIDAAPTKSTGEVNGPPAKQQSDLTIGAGVIPKLDLVKKFIVQARTSSYESKKIKIYDFYNMEIRLGVKTKLNL